MSESSSQQPDFPNLPPEIPFAGRPRNILQVSPARINVVGRPVKGRAAPDNEKGIGMAFALNVIRRWWFVALPTGLFLVAAGSAAVWLNFKPEYAAEAWLKIEDKAPFLAFDKLSDEARGAVFFQTQIELIRSPVVLGAVVERPDIARIPEIQGQSDSIAWLAKQLKVSTVGQSELFKILYTSTDATAAAAIVNAITESYFKLRDQSDADRTQRVVDLLEKEKANRVKEVVRLRQDLSDLSRQLTGQETYTAKPDNDTVKKNALNDLRSRLVTAEVEKAVLAARIEEAEHALEPKAASVGGDAKEHAPYTRPGDAELREAMIEKAILERPDVVKASDAIVSKETRQKEIELRMKDGKKDPVYIQLGRQISEDRIALEALKKSLRPAVEKQIDMAAAARQNDREAAQIDKRFDELARMRSELQGRQILEKQLQAEYDKELRNAKQFGGNTLELEFKYDELARAEKVCELIAARSLQLQTERMAPARVTLLRTADVPVTPVEPYPLKSLALVILAGLCVPFGLAFAWEHWVQRLGGSEDLPATQGLRILGEIAQIPQRLPAPSAKGARPGGMALRVYQESIDNLQTALTLSEEIGSLRFIAITSAVSKEGKSSITSQLALSLSRTINERVLIIDGDMRSPTIHRIFQVARDPGLASVLGRKCELADAIVTTWSDRVHLLPAGKLPRNPLGLLANGAWDDLLARIPSEYRYVIIDTPPVLAASEALILAKTADATLICTMRDRSRTQQVLMVHDRLVAVGGRPIGVVHNGVPTKSYLYRYGNYDYLAKHPHAPESYVDA